MEKKRILVIDDNHTLATIAERVLRKVGFDTMAAFDGPDGLQKARAWLPDIIILDIVMPGIDGYEVAAQLKTEARTAGIPIIFLSARGVTDETEGATTVGLNEINKAFELGANDFLHKPVAASDLIRAVKNVFGLYDVIKEPG